MLGFRARTLSLFSEFFRGLGGEECGVLGTTQVSCDLPLSSDYVVFMPCARRLL